MSAYNWPPYVMLDRNAYRTDLMAMCSGTRSLTNQLIQDYLRIRFDLYGQPPQPAPKQRKKTRNPRASANASPADPTGGASTRD